VTPQVPFHFIKHTNDLLASMIVGNMLDKKLLQSILASHLD
jgi:hypothetical protein